MAIKNQVTIAYKQAQGDKYGTGPQGGKLLTETGRFVIMVWFNLGPLCRELLFTSPSSAALATKTIDMMETLELLSQRVEGNKNLRLHEVRKHLKELTQIRRLIVGCFLDITVKKDSLRLT